MKRYTKAQISDSPYWCAHCDRVKVNDTNGTYYGQFGHTSPMTRDHKLGSGDYTQLVFAVCNDCKSEFFSAEIVK